MWQIKQTYLIDLDWLAKNNRLFYAYFLFLPGSIAEAYCFGSFYTVLRLKQGF
jgi:hypothetical protein